MCGREKATLIRLSLVPRTKLTGYLPVRGGVGIVKAVDVNSNKYQGPQNWYLYSPILWSVWRNDKGLEEQLPGGQNKLVTSLANKFSTGQDQPDSEAPPPPQPSSYADDYEAAHLHGNDPEEPQEDNSNPETDPYIQPEEDTLT